MKVYKQGSRFPLLSFLIDRLCSSATTTKLPLPLPNYQSQLELLGRDFPIGKSRESRQYFLPDFPTFGREKGSTLNLKRKKRVNITIFPIFLKKMYFIAIKFPDFPPEIPDFSKSRIPRSSDLNKRSRRSFTLKIMNTGSDIQYICAPRMECKLRYLYRYLVQTSNL